MYVNLLHLCFFSVIILPDAMQADTRVSVLDFAICSLIPYLPIHPLHSLRLTAQQHAHASWGLAYKTIGCAW